jgi:magnesium transporter
MGGRGRVSTPSPQPHPGWRVHTCHVIIAHLFDRSGSTEVSGWTNAVRGLSDDTVLWVNLQGSADDELSLLREAFGIEALALGRAGADRSSPGVHLREGYLHVAVILAPEPDQDSSEKSVVLNSFVGRNWVVTSHEAGSALVDDFRELATGAGHLGALDALSFLAALLESVIVSYIEAFEAIEATLEDFDASLLASHDRDVEDRVAVLVDARAHVGRLRRALAPHRRIFTILSHAEFDAVSTEVSAAHFSQLAARVEDALVGASHARDAVVSSFNMLILRTGHRTNEIVKVLTLTSILLLPGALIAGLMGMNVNLPEGDFATSGLFWGALIAIALIAVSTLVLARVRRWI